ncbi:PREDICTED: uncharacterized protein LOC104749882 isoform X2 [Camelina sativa]|uniref:Uncharacterized protein LOC104749882 isoform X2 n=1 Tax=Camelina sativa TaxID=90675 RepID=A0ABM0WEN2_CAMSA|nr:PREDICTED: uncharacterized protein LOC104749882 isoform X2 [Camelina sativa]
MALFKAISFLFVLCFEIHGTAGVDFTFSFGGFVKSQNKSVAMFGDSKLVNDSSSIQLTDSVSGSVGRVFYRKPINLFRGFLLEYAKNETVVAFEFDISKRGNRARILIGRPESSNIRNLSFDGDLMMNNGGTLSCMIDYVASYKKMMVNFRRSGSIKEYDPFFSFSVDLAKLWEGGEVMVGLSSANGKSSKAHFLHSWRIETWQRQPMWLHPVPLEQNEGLKADVSTEEEEGRERSECTWRMVGALVLGVVCGALGAMLALYLWTICGVRRSMAVVPEECAIEQGKK